MDQTTPLFDKKTRIYLGLIVLAGAILRILHLDHQSLWLDEAYSIMRAQESVLDIIRNQLKDSSPPLFYVILHYWLNLFGCSELAVRSLSAISGILVIPLTAYLCRYVVRGPLTGQAVLWATSIVAFSPFQVFYSQETRMYMPAALLSITAVTGLVVEQYSRGKGWFFVPAMIGCVWLHNYGWLLWGGLLIFSLLTGLKTWRYHCLVALASLPWLLGILHQVSNDTAAWIPPPSLHFFWDSVVSFAGKAPYLPIFGFYMDVITISTCLFLVLFILGSFANHAVSRSTQLLVSVIFLPLCAAWLLSYIKPMYYPGRYEMIFHAMAAVWIGAAATIKFKYRISLHLLFLLFMICQFFIAKVYYFDFIKSTDRSVAKYLRFIQISDRDLVITTDLTGTPLKYYLPEKSARFVAFPRSEPGWLPRKFLQNDPSFVSTEIEWLDSQILGKGDYDRIILAHANCLQGDQALVEFLDKNLLLYSVHEFKFTRWPNQIHHVRIYRESKKTEADQAGSVTGKAVPEQAAPDSGDSADQII